MHIDSALLRAYLDHELTGADREHATVHLTSCPVCRWRLKELKDRAGRVSTQLTILAPRPTELPGSPRLALKRFQATLPASRKGWFAMQNSIFAPRLRPLWAGLFLLALAIAAVNLPPMRAWAGEFLGLFRVKQVAVLPIDTTRLSELNDNQVNGTYIGRLLSENVSITRKQGPPRNAADAAEAGRLAGYSVRLWNAAPQPPRLTIHSGFAFEFIVDRRRAQAILAEMNRTDISLPADIDGAKIQVDIPNAVTAAYGDCPSADRPETNEFGNPFKSVPAGCTLLLQVPSPTVVTPPNVDILPIIEIGLQLAGMTPAEARVYSRKIDWTSTLVVPLPLYRATYREVTVDGVGGLLVQCANSPDHMLIWVKNEIIYAIRSNSNPVDQTLDMANTLE